MYVLPIGLCLFDCQTVFAVIRKLKKVVCWYSVTRRSAYSENCSIRALHCQVNRSFGRVELETSMTIMINVYLSARLQKNVINGSDNFLE